MVTENEAAEDVLLILELNMKLKTTQGRGRGGQNKWEGGREGTGGVYYQNVCIIQEEE